MATSSFPKVAWRDDAPDGTWVCGCGEVEFLIKKFSMYHGECYCVNCQIQIKVAMSKQKGDYNRCNSPDTGARWMTQAHADKVEYVKGYDKLTFFRCAVTANGESTGMRYPKDAVGDEYKEVAQFHNVITECCGTYVGIVNPGHPPIMDIDNPWRVKGWMPRPKDYRVVFSVSDAHKVQLKWTGEGQTMGPLTGDPCTGMLCCAVAKMCCCGCCTHSVIAGPPCSLQRICCDTCCPCCCKIQIQPAFQPAPMECKEYCGKPMEYINDPAFLKPIADKPKQMPPMTVIGGSE